MEKNTDTVWFDPIAVGGHSLQFCCEATNEIALQAHCLAWAELRSMPFKGPEDAVWALASRIYNGWLNHLVKHGLCQNSQSVLIGSFLPFCEHKQLLELITTWTNPHVIHCSH